MRRSILLVFVASACLVFAQTPPAGGPGPGGPGGGAGRGPGRGLPPPTNLKVLTPETYLGVMMQARSGLGVQCTFCHAAPPNFASDEKPEKVTARKMMQMVKDINANTFNGDAKVTCWTCHRGEQKPAEAPAAGPGGFGGGGRGPGGPGGAGPGGPPPGGAPPQVR